MSSLHTLVVSNIHNALLSELAELCHFVLHCAWFCNMILLVCSVRASCEDEIARSLFLKGVSAAASCVVYIAA